MQARTRMGPVAITVDQHFNAGGLSTGSIPVTEWIGLLALVLVVLTSPFLYDLATAVGFAR